MKGQVGLKSAAGRMKQLERTLFHTRPRRLPIVSTILLLVLVCNLIQLCSNSIFGSRTALYDANDQVYILNVTTTKHEIFNSKRAWLVEFFSSWCGHCVAYAPKWKQFAQDLIDWQSLVVIAGIDCADEVNIPTCRDFEIMGYPTLKLFPPLAPRMIDNPDTDADAKKKILNIGKLFERPESMAKLKTSLMEALVPMFPHLLAPINVSTSVYLTESTQFWQDTYFGKTPVACLLLIYEAPSSSVGLEVALRLSAFQDDIRVLRFHKKNPLYKKLRLSNLPAAAYLMRNGNTGSISIDGGKDLVESLVQVALGLAKITTSSTAKPNFQEVISRNEESQINEPAAVPSGDYVDMEDLLHAIRNLLRNEVGLLSRIGGAKLHALKNFIGILGQYFPADRPEVTTFLVKLSEWVLPQRDIKGEDFISKLEELEKELNPWADVDVSQNGWKGCKGSIPSRRGYTCGLWRLFHTLTLTAFSRREDSPVIPSIYGYMQEFFGCRECVSHFSSMINRDNALELTSIRLQVRWLWRAHNIVNIRLKGGPSEDPSYPKQLYPSIKDCPACYSEDGESQEFDEDNVEEYLMKVYGKIRQRRSRRESAENVVINGKVADKLVQGAENSSHTGASWLGGLFSITDIGIFIIVYISIACLLVLGYIHFKIASKRRRLVDPVSLLRRYLS